MDTYRHIVTSPYSKKKTRKNKDIQKKVRRIISSRIISSYLNTTYKYTIYKM